MVMLKTAMPRGHPRRRASLSGERIQRIGPGRPIATRKETRIAVSEVQDGDDGNRAGRSDDTIFGLPDTPPDSA